MICENYPFIDSTL